METLDGILNRRSDFFSDYGERCDFLSAATATNTGSSSSHDLDDLDDVNSDDVAELLVDIRRELDRTETEFGASIDATAVLDEYPLPDDDGD